VIGATGGSGTRVLARIVREGGMFVGSNLNPYEDAIEMGAFSDRWIDRVYPLDGTLDEATRDEMDRELAGILDRHLADVPEGSRHWGWKEPRSIYLLRFFEETFPDFRYVHFVRDGRDMAYSDNQTQLIKHGATVLDDAMLREKKPFQSIALWTIVNQQAADFGEQVLGDRYLRIRFEDLCSDPATTARSVYEFFGLEGDAEGVATREVSPPSTLGRWRDEKPDTVRRLQDIAEPALDRFGYL
jgi:hypothetical protein